MAIKGARIMSLSKSQAIEVLQKQVKAIDRLKQTNRDSAEFAKWQRDVEVTIERVFGKDARGLKDFRGISYSPGIIQFGEYGERITSDEEFRRRYLKGLETAGLILQSMIEEVENFWPDDGSQGASGDLPSGVADRKLTDRQLMERAIELAKKCVSEPGKVSPKVGAIVARDGLILGEAYRGENKPGEHAEYTLLEGKLKDETLAGTTLFTTLEPCTTRNHPKLPCAARIADRKIAKVVIGTLDRNEDIRGRGEIHLVDAGIKIARFDPDLMNSLDELNRDFIRDIRQRTKAETKDPVDPEAIGPNGFKIGYTENGDKVEWIEEDGETWPMVLRRNDNDILKEYNELWEKVWYIRKVIRFEKMERGEIPYEDQNQPHLIKALERMKEIGEKYGAENLGWDDVEWGIVQGRLSALAWVMGSEWEGSMDT